ncbi:MAG: aminotransferase class V-fold PLP-dependent enzyme [Bacteroidia bacterium]
MLNKRRTFLKHFVSATFTGVILPSLSNSIVNGTPFVPFKLLSFDDSELYWKSIREQFPLKKTRIYLNNGTMGPSPYTVIEQLQKALLDANTNGEYVGHEVAREKIATFLNVKVSEIALTHNTTEGLNIVALGLPLKKGDEVIMTTHEHVGNAAPWLNVAKMRGIIIKTFIPALTAQENLERVESLITAKTKAIAVPHITCTTGIVLPVKQITALAKNKNILVCIDGAHGPGSKFIDIKDIGCDFYASCGHKWLMGPLGTGFLYVNENLLDVLQPYNVGAYAVDKWELSEKKQLLESFVPTAHRYDYGTQSPYSYIALAEALNFISSIGVKRVEERSHKLATYLQQQLLTLDNKIEMLSSLETESRSTMIGFKLKNTELEQFEKKAAENQFRIRGVREANLNSVRISTHIYNNFEEIDAFVDFVKRV